MEGGQACLRQTSSHRLPTSDASERITKKKIQSHASPGDSQRSGIRKSETSVHCVERNPDNPACPALALSVSRMGRMGDGGLILSNKPSAKHKVTVPKSSDKMR